MYSWRQLWNHELVSTLKKMFWQREILIRMKNIRCLSSSCVRFKRPRNIDQYIPKNCLKQFDNGSLQTTFGNVYDDKPFKLKLEKGKLYAWCTCGHSKSQPLCDNTHNIKELSLKLKPIFFKVEETKEYWLCNCKQTVHRPFCDGSHIEIHEENLRKAAKKMEARAEAASAKKT